MTLSQPLATASSPPFLYAGEIAATLSALVWACAGIGFARVPGPISGAALNLGKNLTATIGFALLLLVTKGNPFPFHGPTESVLFLVGSGVVGLAICDTFLMRALLQIGPQRAMLIFCLAPVVTAIGASLPPYNEHPGLVIIAGMAVTLGGIALAVLERPDPSRPIGDTRKGMVNAAIAALLQAAAVLLTRHAMNVADMEGSVAASIRLTTGTVALMAWGLLRGRLRTWLRQIFAPAARIILGISALVGTFGGIWLNQLGIQWGTHTGVVTTLNSLTPIYQLPLSAIFLGERRGPIAWIATLIAILGVALMAL